MQPASSDHEIRLGFESLVRAFLRFDSETRLPLREGIRNRALPPEEVVA